MANTRIRQDAPVFGVIPTIGEHKVPKITGLKDDVKVAEIIGRMASGVQSLLCTTAFYFGRLARKNGDKEYTFDGGYEAYYESFYGTGAGLTEDSKKQQRLSITAYTALAKLPWETADVALWAFTYEGLSMPQKGTLVRAIVKKYGEKAPTAEQMEALVPGGKSKKAPPAILPRAKGIVASFKAVRDDAKVWKLISASPEMVKRFESAEKEANNWALYAEQNKPEKKKPAKKKAAPIDKAALAAARKALATAEPVGKPN